MKFHWVEFWPEYAADPFNQQCDLAASTVLQL